MGFNAEKWRWTRLEKVKMRKGCNTSKVPRLTHSEMTCDRVFMYSNKGRTDVDVAGDIDLSPATKRHEHQ